MTRVAKEVAAARGGARSRIHWWRSRSSRGLASEVVPSRGRLVGVGEDGGVLDVECAIE